MVLFGVVTGREGARYMRYLQNQLRHPRGVLEVLFFGEVTRINNLYVVEIEPRLPKLYLYGFILTASSFVLNLSVGKWSLIFSIPGLFMIFTGVFWLPHLYYILIKLGLRKNNGGGSRLLRGNALTKRVVECHKQKCMSS